MISMDLEEATYPSRVPGFVGDPIRFKYTVIEENRKVFFSGTEQKGTSTVNAAPDVILAICHAARIAPADYTFFDVLTHRGIPGKDPGYCEIHELRISGEGTRLRVPGRRIIAIAQENADIDPSVLDALPEDYRDAFVRLIRE